MRASTSSLSEPLPLTEVVDGDVSKSGSAVADGNADPFADVPELNTYITEDVDEKTAALKLVADGVAQMRQTASRSLIFHPLNMALFIAFCAFLGQWMYSTKTKYSDPWLISSTMAGVVMSGLISVRMFTGPYLEEAEKVKEPLIEDADVFVTKFGDEVIGTCIMALYPSADVKKQKRKTYNAEIRAWAVRLRYRGKEIGTGLLEAAVAEAKKRGADDITFAKDHPFRKRLLYSLYNGPFDRREKRAAIALQTVWETQPKSKKR